MQHTIEIAQNSVSQVKVMVKREVVVAVAVAVAVAVEVVVDCSIILCTAASTICCSF